MADRYDVVIAGAGIGGLAAACFLLKRGFRVGLLERAGTPLEVGAGIQLGPNATRLLEEVGLLDRLRDTAVEPDAIAVRDGLTGRRLARIPLGSFARRRYGAPYLVIHRGDLHRTLADAVAAHPRADIRYESDVTRFDEAGDGVTVETGRGATVRGGVLIGADGLRSAVRRQLLRDGNGTAFGEIAWRTLVPRHRFDQRFAGNETGLWIGPGGHVVHYPVRAGAAVNIVAITRGRLDVRGWSAEGDPDELRAKFVDWSRPLQDILACGQDWRYWPLFDRSPGQHWGSGRVSLLGDAAHPMLPYLAQGGAMAIEDACVLSSCLANYLSDPVRALETYEDLRRERTARVQNAARDNARTFHADGGFRLARNAVLGLLDRFSPGRALTRYDWLYGFDASVVEP